MLEKIRWEKWASIAICLAAGVVLFLLCFKLVFSFLLPFLLAWLISLCITPIAGKISEKTKLPKKVCSVVLFLGVLGGLVFLISASVNRILTELRRLLNRLLSDGNFPSEELSDSVQFVERLTARIGLPEQFTGEGAFRENLNQMLSEMIRNLLSSLSAKLPQIAGRIISAFPSILLFTVVTVIAGFYFCLDRQNIEKKIIEKLPQKIRERVPKWQEGIKHFSWRYLRAYLLLLLLTFGELFLGFSILKIDYAFLLAILIAVVDLLPVLGVGTVLIPWGVVELFRKNFYLGFGLLILYLAVTVFRQILEPRFVGHSLGLHPLVTLMAGYVGWNLLGFLGMALGPVLVLIGKTVVSQIRQNFPSENKDFAKSKP